MARKLYAVTSGEYTDYHIITLTKSRKRAEKIAEMYDANVEEYEDNEELTAKPLTYTVYAYGGADCRESHLDNVEKNVIMGHGFAYVDAWSKQDAERKADVIFKEVREKMEAERKAKEEAYRNTPTWLAKRENGKIYVIPEDNKTNSSGVLFGCRAFIKAPTIEEAMKTAAAMFTDYDANRLKDAR
jgi:hypothetical protein